MRFSVILILSRYSIRWLCRPQVLIYIFLANSVLIFIWTCFKRYWPSIDFYKNLFLVRPLVKLSRTFCSLQLQSSSKRFSRPSSSTHFLLSLIWSMMQTASLQRSSLRSAHFFSIFRTQCLWVLFNGEKTGVLCLPFTRSVSRARSRLLLHGLNIVTIARGITCFYKERLK